MGIIRTEANEHFLFLGGLDALGDDENVVLVGIPDDMSEKTLVMPVRIYSPNVFHIDLDIVRREVDHASEVRVVRSEVVDGYLASESLQFVGGRNHEFAFRSVDALQDFEYDP